MSDKRKKTSILKDNKVIAAIIVGLAGIIAAIIHGMSRVIAAITKDLPGLSGKASSSWLLKERMPEYVLIICLSVLLFLLVIVLIHFIRRLKKKIPVIAICPFINSTGNGCYGELCYGIKNMLISNLSNIEGLRVLSSTTNLEEFKVDYILNGSIQNDGGGFKISFIFTKEDSHISLWPGACTFKTLIPSNVKKTISEIIISTVKVWILGDKNLSLSDQHSKDEEARRFFEEGNRLWSQMTHQAMIDATAYFKKAIDKDPNYAMAYCKLANCYIQRGHWGEVSPPTELFLKAKEFAEKALSRSSILSNTYISLGIVDLQYEWNWSGAKRNFKKAINLNSRSADAYHWYSLSLAVTGHKRRALRNAKIAHHLNPNSPIISASLGGILFVTNHYHRAIEQCCKTLKKFRGSSLANLFLGMTYITMGKFEEGVEQFEQNHYLPGGGKIELAYLGHAYACWGKSHQARDVIKRLKEESKTNIIPPFYFALIYIGLGETDNAIKYLNLAVDKRESLLMWLKVHPYYKYVRNLPQFKDVIKRIGLK